MWCLFISFYYIFYKILYIITLSNKYTPLSRFIFKYLKVITPTQISNVCQTIFFCDSNMRLFDMPSYTKKEPFHLILHICVTLLRLFYVLSVSGDKHTVVSKPHFCIGNVCNFPIRIRDKTVGYHKSIPRNSYVFLFF